MNTPLTLQPWGKEKMINYLIEQLNLADSSENHEMILILTENINKPIKVIRELIWEISYKTTPETEFGINDSLFDIWYTEPEWGWE